MSKHIKKTNVLVFASTKGGVGKSTLSRNVAPFIFSEEIFSGARKLNLYELDNNNVAHIQSPHINYNNIKMSAAGEVLDLVDFEKDDETQLNIIDAGGGDDTLSLLDYFRKTDIKGVSYAIPTTDADFEFNNVKQTIEQIRTVDENAPIFLFLNRAVTGDFEAVKEQFFDFFGSKKYDISGRIDEIIGEITHIYTVPDASVFKVLNGHLKLYLIDFIQEAMQISKNAEARKKEWHAQGKEFYFKQLAILRFAKDVVDYTEALSGSHNFKEIRGAVL